ncbi:type II secretion system protein GspM [Candidatus Colwellia aromaticivorans]|uniref:type II secretion system protein GspM n=1 Tax=Candidatus Colwellia aromaticivorans TaxID=2267621 RepID=UPI001FE2B6E2|nr:type II secretion system protein M [Candidatus Colwellia aromaticivorans]
MDLSSIKSWWQGLNIREQRLVIVMGLVFSAFLLYSSIWQPLNESLAKTEQKLASRQALLTWVTENTARYQNIKSTGGGTKNSGSLSSIINRTANQQQLTITRMQPQGESLQVWLDNAPFTSLLFWLEHLANNENLQVQAIDLAQSDKQGEVRVRRLQLGRK